MVLNKLELLLSKHISTEGHLLKVFATDEDPLVVKTSNSPSLLVFAHVCTYVFTHCKDTQTAYHISYWPHSFFLHFKRLTDILPLSF